MFIKYLIRIHKTKAETATGNGARGPHKRFKGHKREGNTAGMQKQIFTKESVIINDRIFTKE